MKWVILWFGLFLLVESAERRGGYVKNFALRERLGKIPTLQKGAVANFLKENSFLRRIGFRGDEAFEHLKEHGFQDVVRTFRFSQRFNGLKVNGGEVAVHVNPLTLNVEGVTASVVLSGPTPEKAKLIEKGKISELAKRFGHEIVSLEHPELEYVSQDGQALLCWKVPVMSFKRDYLSKKLSQALEPSVLYIDALSHEVVMDVPVNHKATKTKSRKVYNAQNSNDLFAELERSEGDPESSIESVNEAYDNCGKCLDFFQSQFGRNSYDDNGATIVSTVHYKQGYNNAYWNGEQMVYGDGDGILFHNFSRDMSIVCHELTHAVTSSTSNLLYWAESGALNEAFSDIMGISSLRYETYQAPPEIVLRPSPDWVIGPIVPVSQLFDESPEYCPLPLPVGIRYMDNPTCDGSSRDDYKEISNLSVADVFDMMGVHTNSGIANLAFQLTVDGGKHPRYVNDVEVKGVGLEKASKVYFLAFTEYLLSNSKFVDAKNATQTAARVLYPESGVEESVVAAWEAVNVGI